MAHGTHINRPDKRDRASVQRHRPRIVLMIGKGGGGKTSTAIGLALAARADGLRVGILDLDVQKCALTWRQIRGTDDVTVHACSTQEAIELFRNGGANRFDLVLVDCGKDPTAYLGDLVRMADLVLVPTRPSPLDLKVTLDWVDWLRGHGADFAVVINGAPPRRRFRLQTAEGQRVVIKDSPFVREARDALSAVGSRCWRGQMTHLHACVRDIAGGTTPIESEPSSPAAAEMRRLWRDVRSRLSRHEVAA